jgi:ribonuclease HI
MEVKYSSPVTRHPSKVFYAEKKTYAVIKGRNPGIYDTWFGEGGAQNQISGFPGAVYKGFANREDAEQWFKFGQKPFQSDTARKKAKELFGRAGIQKKANSGNGLSRVTIYTDGASRGNPGPGGYGVVLLFGDHRKELSAGFRKTTNNRMEIMGPIAGLEALKHRCKVTVYSDSKYVVNSIMLGWARKWKKNGWKRNSHDPALNADLWEDLLTLCDQHECEFVWVPGHAGIPENERCDELSVRAAEKADLPPDEGYEEFLRKTRGMTHQ